jgi:hypothetical protein
MTLNRELIRRRKLQLVVTCLTTGSETRVTPSERLSFEAGPSKRLDLEIRTAHQLHAAPRPVYNVLHLSMFKRYDDR